MITLINPPGIRTFSGLQMQSAHPPLRLAYIAAASRDPGLPCQIVDGAGEALDVVRPYPDRADFFISPMDFYTEKTPSYADVTSTRRLYWIPWFVDRFYTRRRRRTLAETAQR